MLVTCCIIKKPTMIKAEAVANDGIAENKGHKNKATRNITPVVQEVRPVLPPSLIPLDDSTNVVIVEVPKQEPHNVPTASASNTS